MTNQWRVPAALRGWDSRRGERASARATRLAPILTLLVAGPLLTGTPSVVRAGAASLGFAGAYSLRARGVDSPNWNPATLAWSSGSEVRWFDLDATVRNNAFSTGDYGRWNGRSWTEDDKEAILLRIGDAFEGAFDLAAEGPGLAWRHWAWTQGGRAVGFAALPGEFARLALYGNDPEESYDLGGSDGEAIAWSEFRVSHARQVATWKIGRSRTPVALGLNLKYLRGWAYGEVTRAEGSLVTTPEGVYGEQWVEGRTADGGNGVACDVGLALRGPGRWRLGLSARNLYSVVRWTGRPTARSAFARADSVTVGEGESGEDLVVTESSERAIATFSRTLPASLTLAAARSWGRWEGELDLSQGFARRAGSSRTPRVGVGASYAARRWLEARAGLALGGVDGPVLATGLGFSGWKLRFDLAAATAGGIDFTDPHGFSLGASLSTRWASRAAPLE